MLNSSEDLTEMVNSTKLSELEIYLLYRSIVTHHRNDIISKMGRYNTKIITKSYLQPDIDTLGIKNDKDIKNYDFCYTIVKV